MVWCKLREGRRAGREQEQSEITYSKNDLVRARGLVDSGIAGDGHDEGLLLHVNVRHGLQWSDIGEERYR